MRFIGILLIGLAAAVSAPAAAQEFVGEVGACMIETAAGEPINVGTCKKMPAECNPVDCAQAFQWNQGFATVISLTEQGMKVADGIAMNGQEAYAPAALRDSDPRDCLYNAVSDSVFCWVPGVEAFTLAVGMQSRGDLIALAAAQAPAASDQQDQAALLRPLQGKYIPFPNWSCEVTGGEGGALAIIDDVFYGVETECRLRNGRAVGAHGAAIFDVTCSGEGDTWEDEYILRRDEWGRLGWMSADQVSVMESCD